MKLRRQVNVILIGAMLGLVLRGSHRHSNGRIGSGLAGLSLGTAALPLTIACSGASVTDATDLWHPPRIVPTRVQSPGT